MKTKSSGKNYYVFVLIVLIASVTLLANTYLTQQNPEKAIKVNVVVLAEDVNAETEITAEMLSLEAVPQEVVREGMKFATNKESVVGKVSKAKLYRGEYLLLDRLADEKKEDIELKSFIMPVSNLDKALELRAGDYVDVWVATGGKEGQAKDNVVLFSGLRIHDIKNAEFKTPVEKKQETKEEKAEKKKEEDVPDVFIPEYIEFRLDDGKIAQLMEAQGKFALRIARFSDAKAYSMQQGVETETVNQDSEEGASEQNESQEVDTPQAQQEQKDAVPNKTEDTQKAEEVEQNQNKEKNKEVNGGEQ